MAIYSDSDYGSISQIKKMTFLANSHTTNTINAHVYTTKRPGGDFLI